jgi:PAS domain S-box-containing protein
MTKSLSDIEKIRQLVEQLPLDDLSKPELAELSQLQQQLNLATEKHSNKSSETPLRVSQSDQLQRQLAIYNHIENSSLGCICWDNELRCLSWNKVAEKIFGYTEQEALGQTAFDLILSKDKHLEIDAVRSQLVNQQGGSYSANENITKSGQRIFCEWFNSPLIGEDGNVEGISSLVVDISQSIRAETKFDRFFNQPLNLHLICNLKGEILKINSTWEKTIGYSSDEMLGRPFIDFVHPEDVESTLKELSSLIGGNQTYLFQNRYRHKNGETRVLQWSAIVESDEGSIHAVATDVTQLNITEQSMRRATKLLEYSQAAAMVGGWELDLESGELYWTNETYRIHDTSPEEFDPTVDAGVSYFLPESKRIISEALEVAIEQGIGYHLDLQTYTTKGRLIDVYTTCEVTIRNGKPSKLTGIFQDITERTKVKRRLAKEQSRLVNILESAIDGIILINSSGIIQSFNRAAEGLFKRNSEDVIGENVRILMPSDIAEQHDTFMLNYLSGGAAKIIGIGRELTGIRSDGTHFPIDLSITEWFDGEERMFTGTVRDISEKKRIQSQLVQSQKMESLSQLSGGLAHDFNNLLNVIVGNLDLLEMTTDKSDANYSRVQSAIKAVSRGTEITNRMLQLSRLQINESGSKSAQDINLLLAEMTEILNRTLGASFNVSFESLDRPGYAMVDAAEFENAILNLGLNARDAMSAGGEITIKLDELSEDELAERSISNGHWLKIEFSDNGVGMSNELCGRIFEPFFTTKDGKGSGLGLAMVYGFVAGCKGEISVNSELGEGTTFTILLPLTEQDNHEQKSKPDLQVVGGSESVLLVDDEPEILETTSTHLKALGYSVKTASDGDSALEVLNTQSFDLLFTDVTMPGSMLGTELALRAHRLYPKMAILLSSGFSRKLAEDEGFKRFRKHLLTKPYRRDSMAVAVRRAIDKRNFH